MLTWERDGDFIVLKYNETILKIKKEEIPNFSEILEKFYFYNGLEIHLEEETVLFEIDREFCKISFSVPVEECRQVFEEIDQSNNRCICGGCYLK